MLPDPYAKFQVSYEGLHCFEPSYPFGDTPYVVVTACPVDPQVYGGCGSVATPVYETLQGGHDRRLELPVLRTDYAHATSDPYVVMIGLASGSFDPYPGWYAPYGEYSTDLPPLTRQSWASDHGELVTEEMNAILEGTAERESLGGLPGYGGDMDLLAAAGDNHAIRKLIITAIMQDVMSDLLDRFDSSRFGVRELKVTQEDVDRARRLNGEEPVTKFVDLTENGHYQVESYVTLVR